MGETGPTRTRARNSPFQPASPIARQGILEPHIEFIRAIYKERRDVMLAAMEQYFPPGVSWTRPQGGLFLWVTMPEHLDSQALWQVALREKVAFVPGTAFYPDGRGGQNCIRLNFSNAAPEKIREGIGRLGRAMGQMLD